MVGLNRKEWMLLWMFLCCITYMVVTALHMGWIWYGIVAVGMLVVTLLLYYGLVRIRGDNYEVRCSIKTMEKYAELDKALMKKIEEMDLGFVDLRYNPHED